MPHISKSQMESLMSCPRLYWYERHGGLERTFGIGATLGSTYHAVWEQFFRPKISSGQNKSLEWVQDTFVTEFDTRVEEGVASGSLEFDEGEDVKNREIGLGLVEAYLPFAETIQPLAVEKSYHLSIPNHDWTLHGYIDLIYKSFVNDVEGKPVIDPDTEEQKWVAVVVDHKTAGSSPYDQAKPGRYESWLELNRWNHEVIGYCLAYRTVYGKTEDRFEYHHAIKTRTPKIVVSKVKIGKPQIDWFMDLAVEQIDRIKRGYFERNTTSWKHTPRFCGAWGMCHGILDEPKGTSQLRIV